jgi:hypothetical protein
MLRSLTVGRVVLVLAVAGVFGMAAGAGGALVGAYISGKSLWGAPMDTTALAAAAQADLGRELQCFGSNPLACPQDIFFRLASLVDYKCYKLESKDERPDLNQPMLLQHWNPVFKGRTENVVVREPSLLCTPVTKTTR